MTPQAPKLSPIARHVLRGGLTQVLFTGYDDSNSNNEGYENPKLPGCTESEEIDRPLSISSHLMQAYVMMRGPCQGEEHDSENPILDWMELCKDTQDNTKMDHRQNVMDHSCCADFDFEEENEEEEEEIEEGHDESEVPRGRISPCTFLAWAKGCKRWAPVGKKVFTDEQSNMMTNLPNSNSVANARRLQNCVTRRRTPDRIDGRNGHSDSPSLLWIAEGIESNRLKNQAEFEDQYAHMDPQAAKKLRCLVQTGHPVSEAGVHPAGICEDYSRSEVDAVVENDIVHTAPGLTLQQVKMHLSSQYAVIAAAEAECATITAELREQNDRIRHLQMQKDAVRLAVWNIKNKRAEQAEAEAAAATSMSSSPSSSSSSSSSSLSEGSTGMKNGNGSRHNPGSVKDEERAVRIRAHFRGHLREVNYRHHRAVELVTQERRTKEFQDELIRELEHDIRNVCREVGKAGPEGVYRELCEWEGVDSSSSSSSPSLLSLYSAPSPKLKSEDAARDELQWLEKLHELHHEHEHEGVDEKEEDKAYYDRAEIAGSPAPPPLLLSHGIAAGPPWELDQGTSGDYAGFPDMPKLPTTFPPGDQPQRPLSRVERLQPENGLGQDNAPSPAAPDRGFVAHLEAMCSSYTAQGPHEHTNHMVSSLSYHQQHVGSGDQSRAETIRFTPQGNRQQGHRGYTHRQAPPIPSTHLADERWSRHRPQRWEDQQQRQRQHVHLDPSADDGAVAATESYLVPLFLEDPHYQQRREHAEIMRGRSPGSIGTNKGGRSRSRGNVPASSPSSTRPSHVRSRHRVLDGTVPLRELWLQQQQQQLLLQEDAAAAEEGQHVYYYEESDLDETF
ncbi:hypothetical protein BX600DRAFT_492814 [Xylariales sp. PMI_506]|nr:hypothetical protein BX600DRAFT_492814 [Xylariales sp. PMI_506]